MAALVHTEEVYGELQDMECALASELARELVISTSTARRHLEALVARGWATRSKGLVLRHGRHTPAVYYYPAHSGDWQGTW